MKKPLIIAVAIAAILIAAGLALLLRGGSEPMEVAPTPSATSTSTASPSADPELHSHSGQGGFDAKEREVEANPLLKDLPRHTAFWFLTFEGTQGGKYLLNAMVFYRPNENPQAKLDEQKPRIESFIRDTGQAEGTYVVNYTTRLVGTD